MSRIERFLGGRINESWEHAPYLEFDDVRPGDRVRLGGYDRKVFSVYRMPTDHVRSIEVVRIRRLGSKSPTTYVDRSAMYVGGEYEWGGFVSRGGGFKL